MLLKANEKGLMIVAAFYRVVFSRCLCLHHVSLLRVTEKWSLPPVLLVKVFYPLKSISMMSIRGKYLKLIPHKNEMLTLLGQSLKLATNWLQGN